MDNQIIKDNIFKARWSKGISQDTMAEQMGISRTAYRNFEKGKTQIVSNLFFKFAEAIELSPEEIILGYQPEKDASLRLQEASEEYKNQSAKTSLEYERMLSAKDEEIALLHEYVNDLHAALKDKDELIQFYKNRK